MTSKELALKCAGIASEKKGQNLTIIKIGDISNIADFFVIVSGTSSRQIQTIADEIETYYKTTEESPRIEGYKQANWIVIDMGDVVVHLFTPDLRYHFDLEALWQNAPRIKMSGETIKEEETPELIWTKKRRL
ncbi:MAG: ribosome silencing factor [Deltaproteobacteria bacterium RIFCSPHIGHO2_12_FULL_43_9]|nr:MAG: ribosome silencing factor [Deltaproteobacteria bacterium RIFCSPHIGHO2_12_FULL_43_9]